MRIKPKMDIKQELRAIKDSFLPWVGATLGIAAFALTFGLERGYPYPSMDSISMAVMRGLIAKLVPEGVQAVTLNPLEVFISLIIISLAIGLIASFPLFFVSMVRYIKPGLYPHEMKKVLWISVMATALFVAGVLFAYWITIPETFDLLYRFSQVAEIGSLFRISEFMMLVFGLMVAVGVMFQLPVAMVLLSHSGLVDAGFWASKWKEALVGILLITAVITPDGSGVSMAMLCMPLVGLYAAGIQLSKRR